MLRGFRSQAGVDGKLATPQVNVTVDTNGRLIINGAEPAGGGSPPDVLVIDMYTLGGVPAGARVLVDGTITDPGPAPSGFGPDPRAFWQRFFAIEGSLSAAPADASGHIHWVYPSTASTLGNELCMGPPGYPSGTALYTFHLPSGDASMYLSFQRPAFC